MVLLNLIRRIIKKIIEKPKNKSNQIITGLYILIKKFLNFQKTKPLKEMN